MKYKLFYTLAVILLVGCQPIKFEKSEDSIKETEETENSVEKTEVTDNLTNEELYQANFYFSSLSDYGFREYDAVTTTNEELLNFASWLYLGDGGTVDHETMDGIYYDVFKYEDFNEKINLYFNRDLEKQGTATWGFQDDKFYRPALESGSLASIVTQVDRAYDNGDGSFLVEGTIYRYDPAMVNYSYTEYLQPKSTWQPAMECELIGNMKAILRSPKDTERLVIDSYKTTYVAYEYSEEFSAQEEPAQEESVQEESVQEEKVYSKDEINNILISLDKGALYDDNSEDEMINGEICYRGNIVYGSSYRTRDFYVGSETLTMYNIDGEPKGDIYDSQDFDIEF